MRTAEMIRGWGIPPLLYAVWLHAFNAIFMYTGGLNRLIFELAFLMSFFPVFFSFIFNQVSTTHSSILPFALPLLYLMVAMLSNLFGMPDQYWYIYLANLAWLFFLSFRAGSLGGEFVLRIYQAYAQIGALVITVILASIFLNSEKSVLGIHPNYIGLVAVSVAVTTSALKFRPLQFYALTVSLFLALVVVSRTSAGCVLIAAFLVYTRNVWVRQLGSFLFVAAKSFLKLTLLLSPFLFYFGYEIFNKMLLLNDVYRGLDSGFSGRTDRWASAIDYWEKSPFWGIGYGQSTDAIGYSLDNAYLTVLVELGVVGLLVYIVWMFYGAASINLNSLRRNECVQTSVIIFFVYLLYGVLERRHFNAGNPFSILFSISLFYLTISSVYPDTKRKS